MLHGEFRLPLTLLLLLLIPFGGKSGTARAGLVICSRIFSKNNLCVVEH